MWVIMGKEDTQNFDSNVNYDEIIKKLKYYRKKSYNAENNRIQLLNNILVYISTQKELDNNCYNHILKDITQYFLKSLIGTLNEYKQKTSIPRYRSYSRELTLQEQKVLDCIIKGYNYPQIMSKLGIQKSTVQCYITNICQKYDIWENVGIKALRDLFV